METSEARYSRTDLTAALRQLRIRAGDTVFVHVCLDALGVADGCPTTESRCAMLLAALLDVVGASGTLLVPTYTFSFCQQQPFDVKRTPTPGGPWSTSVEFLEYFRRLPGVVRSRDPIHSVAAFGPLASELLTDVAPTCFGAGSVFDRLRQVGGKICVIGAGLGEATFLHHVEEMVGVPFRYRKLFTGTIRDGDATRKAGWLYNVHILAENGTPDGGRLEAKARAAGVCRAVTVGAGEILAVESRAFFDLTSRALVDDPWLTARGPAGDPVAFEDARVGNTRPDVHLPPDASMAQMIDALWRLPRDLVSDGYDAALGALATQLPMTIHEYSTGTESWSWIVPEKWTCHEAYLETLDGRRLFSYADHPLHVVSYSLPFEGEVTREELFTHLHVHHQLADAVPFIFKYYERDWGLCCTRAMRETLTDERYRVVIRTSSSYGTLKVGEVVVPGRTDDSIVLCAHLCHPAMVNDDLSGVVVGMDVMRALLSERRDLRYTYRFLIVPETIGSVAYLSHHEELIPRMKGGLFLEMLGAEQPHSLQRSIMGDTELDECFTLALEAHDPYGWAAPFWKVIGNDERQFNAPGVRVPMLSLSRVLPMNARNWPYLGYHSSADNPDLISIRRLEDSRDLVLRMIDTIDTNATPVNRFKGEVFCSRYGLHIDWWENRDANQAFFDVLMLIDGTRSIAQIAKQCGVPFESARAVVEALRAHGLVDVPARSEAAAPVQRSAVAPAVVWSSGMADAPPSTMMEAR